MMKIELRIQQYHRRTHRHTERHTEWLLELLVGAKNKQSDNVRCHNHCILDLNATSQTFCVNLIFVFANSL